jgi:hypothetical protein
MHNLAIGKAKAEDEAIVSIGCDERPPTIQVKINYVA